MKLFLFILSIVIVFTIPCACSKTTITSNEICAPRPVDADSSSILAYINNNNITGTQNHPSGLYYKIESSGALSTPTLSSKVFVKYVGRLADNRIFDSTTNAFKTGWVLSTLIEGWKIGLPLISKGGRIKLFIPSGLGYGCTGARAVPGNSILIFEIELVDVK